MKLLLDKNLSDRIINKIIKFIYLRIGNSPTSKIVEILRDNFSIIRKFYDSETESILILS